MSYTNSQAGIHIVADIPVFDVIRSADNIPGNYLLGNTYANGDITVANNTVLGNNLSTNLLKNPNGKPISMAVPLKGGNYLDMTGNPLCPVIYFDVVAGTNQLTINRILSV